MLFMHENDKHMKYDIQDKNTNYQNDEMKKMIEKIEEKAFMAGYEYAIEVLITGRVQKK